MASILPSVIIEGRITEKKSIEPMDMTEFTICIESLYKHSPGKVENWLNEHDPDFKDSQCNWMCSEDQIPINWMNDKGEYTHDWRML